MAYPPTTYNYANRTNTTVSDTTHPSDHNVIRDAVTDILNELGSDPSGTWATVQARLADVLELQTSAAGDITGTQVMKGPVRFTKAIDIDTTLNVDGASTMGQINTDGNVEGGDEFVVSNGQGENVKFSQVGVTGQPANSIGMYASGNLVGWFSNSFLVLTEAGGAQRFSANMQSVNTLLAATGTLRLQGATQVTVNNGGVDTNLVPGAWTNIAVGNGWVDFVGRQDAEYRKVGDIVEMRGTLSGGTITDGTILCTLPALHRPLAHDNFPCASSGGADGGGAYLYVTSTGQVQLWQATNGNMVGLSGVRFSTV